MEKSSGNTRPMEASSLIFLVLISSSVSTTVTTPIAAAPRMRKGEESFFTTKKANTMPSRMEWLTASDISDTRLSTKNVPTIEHATATTDAMSRISSWGVMAPHHRYVWRPALPPARLWVSASIQKRSLTRGLFFSALQAPPQQSQE